MMHAKPSVLVAAIAGLFTASAPAAVLPARFEQVAETGAAYRELFIPALNDAGTAAFVAGTPDGSFGVYSGNAASVQRVPYGGVVSWPWVDINNAGQIAFGTMLPPSDNDTLPTDVVLRAGPGGITEIGRIYRGVAGLRGGPLLDDSGLVAFSTFGNESQVRGGDGAGRQVAVMSWPAFDVGPPRINNAGRIAVSAYQSSPILYYNGEPIAGEFSSFTDPDTGVSGPLRIYGYDVGDNDRVVFAAMWNNQIDGFYLWNNGTISKVAGNTNGAPAVNDLGVVAGLVTGVGPDRIVVFENGVEGTVISVGSPFDGSTVRGLAFSPEGFNNQNQIAFLAELADGRTVNVIATVPEPGAAAALFLVPGAGLLARRRRRFEDRA